VKICRTCKKLKPFSEFHRNIGIKDGHLHHCKPCRLPKANAGMRTEKYRAQARARYAANPQRKMEHIAGWRERNPERWRTIQRASSALHRALKAGKLIRPDTCFLCGRTGRIEAAHEDYSRPLDVVWMCRPCHREWDATQPKS